MKKRKICFVVSEVMTARSFLKGHIDLLSNEFDVYLVANIREDQLPILDELSITNFKHIEIVRKIDLIKDFKAVFSLKKYFNEMNFYAVHSVTPKAGFVTAIAGKMALIKNRINIFTGQVWATKSGIMRYILISADKVVALLDTHIIVDCEAQRDFLISNKIIKAEKSQVLGSGSICGVDIQKFHPSEDIRHNIRKKVGITDGTVVYGFLGRLNYDKGIDELFSAFSMLYETNKNVFLMIVGVDEEGYIEHLEHYPLLKPNENFHFYGHTIEPENVIQAFDVFCLPSHREAFGMSLVESACLGIPTICSNIYGLRDTIVDNVTGLRHNVSDIESLHGAMSRLYNDKILRVELGKNGRNRVIKNYSSQDISNAWLEFYRTL